MVGILRAQIKMQVAMRAALLQRSGIHQDFKDHELALAPTERGGQRAHLPGDVLARWRVEPLHPRHGWRLTSLAQLRAPGRPSRKDSHEREKKMATLHHETTITKKRTRRNHGRAAMLTNSSAALVGSSARELTRPIS